MNSACVGVGDGLQREWQGLREADSGRKSQIEAERREQNKEEAETLRDCK